MYYYARRALPDVKALEELFVETTLELLSSLPVWSAKTQLSHWYTQKTKRSLTMAVLRALLPKTIKPSYLLVQLDISYQTLQDIRCASSTNADFEKALADRSTNLTSPREARGPDLNLRSRASAIMPHLLLYLFFVTNRVF